MATQTETAHDTEAHEESHLKTYTAIYIALLVLAAAKYVFFDIMYAAGTITYIQAFIAVMILASAKTTLIAGWFQHLKDEPRSLTYLMLLALSLVLLLGAAATYSIT